MATNCSSGKAPTGGFVASYAPEQLLLRYARGRIAHFAGRQVLTVVGALMLFATAGWQMGVAVVALALLGEAADCAFLRTIPRRLEQGASLHRLFRVSALTGAFQAAAIAACALLSWFATAHHTLLFTAAFLATAALNAGLIFPFHRTAALYRLVVYLVTLIAVATEMVTMRDFTAPEVYLDIAGLAVLTYMISAFLSYVATAAKRNQRQLRVLTDQGDALERANAALVESKRETEQLSLVARHANDGVIVCNARREVLWVNETFTRITGYTLEDAFGKRLSSILAGPNTDMETVAGMLRATEAGQPFRGEVEIQTRDGRDVWVESNQVPIFDSQGNVDRIITVERDITEQKLVAQKLDAAKREAEQGARAKSEFLATVTHELRTPMNGIIGMSDLICGTDLTEEQQLYADTIRSSASSLLHLIDDILDFSKLDAAKMKLNAVDYDLPTCLEETVLPFRAMALERSLWLVLEIDEDLPQYIHGDDKRLRQVLVNLIGNALKFTESGGIRIKVSINAGLDAHKINTHAHQIDISVQDTGIGIDKDKLDCIFQEFSQAESDTTRRFGGTGLGLAISRKLVRMMGGEITVSSEPDEGSCFSVHLPLIAANRSATTPEPVLDTAPLFGKTILLAEDNRTNQILIEKYLKDTGIRLLIANDGVAAVRLEREHAPDLILMDMSMPLKNGIDAARDIRAGPGAQPIIVALTANSVLRDREDCTAVGMNGFMTKPIRRVELLQALIHHLTSESKAPLAASG